MNSSASSVTSLVPGGVVTTQNISTVIRPKENNESMKFVKIHETELSRNAAEQIRVAEERKISKNKIKEEDEAWQENLRGWREQRRQQFGGILPTDDDEHNNNQQENGRKIKTFAEMLEERAKAGKSLNYHLQKYIGSDDSEHSPDESEDFPTPKKVHIKNDNDHSNLIHDLNLQDNKDVLATKHSERRDIDDTRRNFPPTNIKQQQTQSVQSYSSLEEEDERDDKFEEEKFARSHNNNNNNTAEFDDFDELAQKPINSTFKQGIEKPPTPSTLHSTDKIKPMLDIEIQPNGRLVPPERMDDRQSDYDEEEDEEEEEQKHQQRVAFVAKLKAFEQMAQPVTREPRFVPTRPSRQPPRPPKIISPKTEVRLEPLPQPKLELQDLSLSPKQLRDSPKQIEQNAPHQPRQSPELSPRQYPQLSPRLSPETQPQLYPTEELRHYSRHQQDLPQQVQPSPPLPSVKVVKAPELMLPAHPQQPVAPRHHVQPRQPRSQPNQANMSRQTAHSQQTSQTPLKEDKPQDRTVLSVSGKKRCSSCKEELGRGAAAFVIESLNLVYHTNCFRCSVCHVNLSNGFRGVDVRVHAGALHCQNCYSKDGLNYSRV